MNTVLRMPILASVSSQTRSEIFLFYDSAADTGRRVGFSGKALAGFGSKAGFRAFGSCDQEADCETPSRDPCHTGKQIKLRDVPKA